MNVSRILNGKSFAAAELERPFSIFRFGKDTGTIRVARAQTSIWLGIFVSSFETQGDAFRFGSVGQSIFHQPETGILVGGNPNIQIAVPVKVEQNKPASILFEIRPGNQANILKDIAAAQKKSISLVSTK